MRRNFRHNSAHSYRDKMNKIIYVLKQRQIVGSRHDWYR